MNLTEEAIKEFHELWQEDHPGQTLPRNELVKMAGNTLRVFELISRPIPGEKIKSFKNLFVQDLVLERINKADGKGADSKKIC